MPLNRLGQKIVKVADTIKDEKIASRLRNLAKKYGMISTRDDAIYKCNEQIQKATQKYYQIMLTPDDPSVNHWEKCLNSILLNIEKINTNKDWKSGFILFNSELDEAVSNNNMIGFYAACKHLNQYNFNPEEETTFAFLNPNLKLDDLYSLVDRNKPNYVTKYKQ